MPLYEFETEQGERLEAYYPMGAAPRIDEWVQIEGVPAKRVLSSMPQIADSKGQTNYRLHSNGCPNLATIKHQERLARKFGREMPVRAPKYDDKGRAVFTSPKQLEDYCKRDGRYKVGNRLEVAQEHIRAVDAHRAKQLNQVKERERELAKPEVQT